MLKIQEFISCFDQIKEANDHLSKELSIKVESNFLYSLNGKFEVYIYNKGKHSDINNPLVREANSLILGKDGSLISKRPNHHYRVKKIKDLPDSFRLYKSNVEEMTTGIMITMFNYDGVWNIADKDSVNNVDYSIDVKKTLNNRIDGYWTSIFDDKEDTGIAFKDQIYVFDFISSAYESIWPCTTFKLYLLTVIDKKTGIEFAPYIVDHVSKCLNFSRPKHEQITGKKSLSFFMLRTRIPNKGIMLNDGNTRVKISNALYYNTKSAVEAEHNIKPIHIAKIVLSCRDKVDLMVVSNAFPEYNDFLYLFDKTIEKTWQNLVVIWNSIKEFDEDPATFSKAVPIYPLSHLLFMYRNKKNKNTAGRR